MNNSRYKLIGIGVIAVVLLFIGYLTITTISRQNKIAVRIDAFPSDAQITIDERKVKRGTIYLDAGTYTVKASRDGFKDYTNDLVVDTSLKTYVISMDPNTQVGYEWVKNHDKELMRIRGVGEQAAHESAEDFNKKNPIVANLPYRTFMYTIGYRADPTDPTGDSIIIEIDANEAYRQTALNRIRELGYDPTDFTINFRNYENPFPL